MAPQLGYSDGLAAVESGRTGYSGEDDFQELTGISALAIDEAMALAANRYAASMGLYATNLGRRVGMLVMG